MRTLTLIAAFTVALISTPVHAGDSQQDADRPAGERVRQVEAKALGKLRHPSMNCSLEGLLQ